MKSVLKGLMLEDGIKRGGLGVILVNKGEITLSELRLYLPEVYVGVLQDKASLLINKKLVESLSSKLVDDLKGESLSNLVKTVKTLGKKYKLLGVKILEDDLVKRYKYYDERLFMYLEDGIKSNINYVSYSYTKYEGNLYTPKEIIILPKADGSYLVVIVKMYMLNTKTGYKLKAYNLVEDDMLKITLNLN